jgi:hypothetical protein
VVVAVVEEDHLTLLVELVEVVVELHLEAQVMAAAEAAAMM